MKYCSFQKILINLQLALDSVKQKDREEAQHILSYMYLTVCTVCTVYRIIFVEQGEGNVLPEGIDYKKIHNAWIIIERKK